MFAWILILAVTGIPERAQVAAALAYAAIAIASMENGEASSERPEPSPIEIKPPTVQCLIFSGPHCPHCERLKTRLQRDLVDDLQRRGQRPWRLGDDPQDQFRIVDSRDFPAEHQQRGIESIPQVIWQVHGREYPTRERNPAALATEFIRLQKELNK